MSKSMMLKGEPKLLSGMVISVSLMSIFKKLRIITKKSILLKL